jgi:hypothetical protein
VGGGLGVLARRTPPINQKKKKKKKERQREMKQYKKEWNGMFLSLSVTYKKK